MAFQMQDGEMIDINDPYFNEPQPYSYIPELSPYAGVAGTGSITNNPFNPNYGRVGGPNRGVGNNPMNNVGNTNIVPTAARIPVAPPPGYRPGIDPEWNYFPNSNPPATTIGQYPYGITPPANLPNFGNVLAGVENLDFSNLDLSNLDLSGLGFSQPSTPSVQQPATPEIAQPTMPEIDYDLLASKLNLPSQPAFEMPDYSDLSERLAGIETGLGGLETRFQNFQVPEFKAPEINYDLLADKINMPDYTQQFQNLQTGLGGLGSQIGGLQTPSFEMPDFDYNQLAGNIAGQIQMPSFEMPDYSQQFANIQQGLGGLGTQLGNFQMPSLEVPDYSQQFTDLSTQLGGLGTQLGNFQMPSFEMPDYSQQFAYIQTGLGGLGTQLGNMPSFQMPDYSQQFEHLQGCLGGLGEQIGGLQTPSFEMPDYSQQFADIQSGLGGLGQQIGNMPSYEMPNYNQQFESLQQQIGNMGYGGPSLEQIQDIMSGYQMPDYSSQFQDLQNQIGNIGYGGTNLYNDPFSSGLGVSDRPGGFGGFAKGGSIRYQVGEGIAGLEEGAEMTEGNGQLIEATIMVIQGMAPDQGIADAIINQFIGLYGQEAFIALREKVLNPDGQAQTQGMIEGFGGGMDDFVHGIAGSQDRIAASPGADIVPADVVTQLGDGNSEEGSRKLDGMLERTRMAKTGTREQAPPIDSRKVLPV